MYFLYHFIQDKFFSYFNYVSISYCHQQTYPIQPNNICVTLNTCHQAILQKGNTSLYLHQQRRKAQSSTPLLKLHFIPFKYLVFIWPFMLDLTFLNTGENEHSPHAWEQLCLWPVHVLCTFFPPALLASCYIKFELRKDSVMLQILPIFTFVF